MRDAKPPSEQRTIARPRACGVVDATRDTRFDRVVFQLAQIIRTPMALIAFVDLDHLWTAARVGLPRPGLPRIDSFIATTVGYDDVWVVEDARDDRRFADTPCGADQSRIRFYAGTEIRAAGGLPRGVLCAIDTRPRVLTGEQRMIMRGLAREVEALIQNRLNGASQPH